ncbi:hypothetical protein C8R43DRAFT_1118488 [Mycena crocata]|nr:hypothetical protein C8R43DRAFT_1118488 [Mycena crocata]
METESRPFSSNLFPNAAQLSQLQNALRENLPLPHAFSHNSILSSAPAELAQYDKTITDLELAVAQLRVMLVAVSQERTAFRAYVDGCRSASALIRRLPAEMLLEIISYLSARFDSDIWDPPSARARLLNADVLHFSQVCSYWRGIAVGASGVWSTIVVLPRHLEWSRETVQSFVSLFLDRSGVSPLSVELSTSKPIGECALALLSAQSHRWLRAKLVMRLPSSLQFMKQIQGNLPILEELHLYGEGWSTAHTLFNQAPRLRSLTCKLPATSIPRGIPWPQLSDFDYLEGRLVDLIRLWGAMPPLPIGVTVSIQLNLRLSRTHEFLPFAGRLQPTTSGFGNLALHLIADDPAISRSVLGEIFKKATFPHMHQLQLYPGVQGASVGWPHNDFVHLSSRSMFLVNLTVLIFDSVIISDTQLAEVLSILPALETLSVSDCERAHTVGESEFAVVTNNLLRLLVWRQGPTCLVPVLRSVRMSSLLRFDEHIFLDFLVSRLNHGGTFRYCLSPVPGHERQFCSDVVSQLKQCVRRGVLHYDFI